MCWATSAANLSKRLKQYAAAPHACEPAIALSDQLALLLDLLRDAFHLCSASGKRRKPQGVRAELTRLVPRIADLDCAALSTAITPIRDQLDDMVVPFEHAQVLHAQRRDAVPQHA